MPIINADSPRIAVKTLVYPSCMRVRHMASKYKGVFHDEQGWYAQISQGSAGIVWHTPLHYDTQKEAALAYDEHIRLIYGMEGKFNFPREGEQDAICRDPFCKQCQTEE